MTQSIPIGVDFLSPLVFDQKVFAAMYDIPVIQQGRGQLQQRWMDEVKCTETKCNKYPDCPQGNWAFSPNAYFRYAKNSFDMETQNTGECERIIHYYLSQGVFQSTATYSLDNEASNSAYSEKKREGDALFPPSNLFGWKTEGEVTGNMLRQDINNPRGLQSGCMNGAATPDNLQCFKLGGEMRLQKGTMSGMPTYTLSFWYKGGTEVQVIPDGTTNANILRYGLDPSVKLPNPQTGIMDVQTNDMQPSIGLTSNAHLIVEVEMVYKLITIKIPMPFGFPELANSNAVAASQPEWTHLTVVVDRNGVGTQPVFGETGDANTKIAIYKDGVLLHKETTSDGPPKSFPAVPAPKTGEEAAGAPEFRFLMLAKSVGGLGTTEAQGQLLDLKYYPGSPLTPALVKTAYEESRDRFKLKPLATPPTPEVVTLIGQRMTALRIAEEMAANGGGEELLQVA